MRLVDLVPDWFQNGTRHNSLPESYDGKVHVPIPFQYRPGMRPGLKWCVNYNQACVKDDVMKEKDDIID